MILEHTALRQAKLLSILRREMGLSDGLVGKLKWRNALLVNGIPVHTNYIVRPGDVIRAEIWEQAEGFAPQPMPLCVVYEDESLIVVEKPAGILVHPSPARNSGTLANGLLFYFQEKGTPSAIHPVTRLDRDTFGLVLFAKSAHIHAKFCRMLQQRELQKTYHAAVFGGPEQDAGVIDLPIGRVGGGSLLRKIDPEGQAAVTHFTVLSRGEQTSLLELKPETGRTHQLRLHCAASGFPILGDPQYCSDASKAVSDALGLSFQQLCATQLEFNHPLTGGPICLRSSQTVRTGP